MRPFESIRKMRSRRLASVSPSAACPRDLPRHAHAAGAGAVDHDHLLLSSAAGLTRAADSRPASATAPVPWMSSLKDGTTSPVPLEHVEAVSC